MYCNRTVSAQSSDASCFSAKMFFLLEFSLVLLVSVLKCHVTDWLSTRDSGTLRKLQAEILALRILILFTSVALVSLTGSCFIELDQS